MVCPELNVQLYQRFDRGFRLLSSTQVSRPVAVDEQLKVNALRTPGPPSSETYDSGLMI